MPNMLMPDVVVDFHNPIALTVTYQSEEYEIQGVISVSKNEAGSIFYEKHDGSFGEVVPGYLRYEIVTL
jgi:hypothetical protein